MYRNNGKARRPFSKYTPLHLMDKEDIEALKLSPKFNQKEDAHMNLTDAYNKPLKEILADCNITNQKINSDDTGRIMSIEIKYVPKDVTK